VPRNTRITLLVLIAVGAVLVGHVVTRAQQAAAAQGPSARALAEALAAPMSFVGDWNGRYHEDQPDRVPGQEPNDYTGLPLNDAARMYADSFDVERTTLLEHICAPYALPYIFHGPLQFRVSETHDPDTQELISIDMYLGTYQQRRTIWMDGRPHPPEYAPHTWMGFSTGVYNGDVLTVTTTHLKAGFFRRSGVPSSDRTTMVEHFVRYGTTLSQVTIATDPVYLTEPWIRSQEFVLMERGNQNWLYNCEYAMEIPGPRNHVKHFLPGKNPYLNEIGERYGIPQEGVRGGAETLYPEYLQRMQGKGGATPARPATPAPAATTRRATAAPASNDVQTLRVQGNVYMLVTPTGNVAVQAGEDGVLVVDTGGVGITDKLLAAVRQISKKDIRWIVNTSMSKEHTSGNEAFSKAGRTVNGNPAAIISHENAALRMAKAGVPSGAQPFNTYFEETRDFPFNTEPVILYHNASSNTDTDTMVFFRRSDVIATGDVFNTVSYPVIDAANGGTLKGIIDGVNHVLELAVPSKDFEEGGTFIIPGRGRLCDEADLVEYRDMLAIIYDRIADLVQQKKTLAQVKAAKPTMDYDGRWGSDTGSWTTDMFIEAVFNELSRPAATGAK
jgi:glyoxylase-like metal-dependent hydrolase (beta-lactamase superfamily II)